MANFLRVSAVFLLGAMGCREGTLRATDLAGTWIATAESRRLLPSRLQSALATFVLTADGKFLATEVPGEVLYLPAQGRNRLVTGSGVWKIVGGDGKQDVHIEFSEIAGAGAGDVPFGTRLHLSMSDNVPTLFYFQGDPDEGVRIEFCKR